MKMHTYISRRHPAIWIACIFFLASALIRLWHYSAAVLTSEILWIHVVMPVSAAFLFLAGMALGGKWAKAGVITATVLGVAFFIIKATGFTPLHQTLCTILYITVLVLFISTVLGLLPTKKLLYPLFGLPLIYHIIVEDTQKYFFARPPVPVWEWMPEISVLCIMAGLLCFSIGLKCTGYRKEVVV